jgi:hypothetical protein
MRDLRKPKKECSTCGEPGHTMADCEQPRQIGYQENDGAKKRKAEGELIYALRDAIVAAKVGPHRLPSVLIALFRAVKMAQARVEVDSFIDLLEEADMLQGLVTAASLVEMPQPKAAKKGGR